MIENGRSSSSLTELEGAILGIVASREPCSSYAVRQRIATSPTWGWSSSQGAIYPAVKRLVASDLLSTETIAGARKTELLSLTVEGRQALSAWLLSVSEEMGYAPVDPLRTRVNYLAALDERHRREFFDLGEAYITKALELARASEPDPEAHDRSALEASRLGARLQLEAKLAWWHAIRSMLVRN